MKKIILTIFGALFPLLVFADYSNTGIQIDCFHPKGETHFHAETLMNEPAMWAAAPAGARDKFLKEARAQNLFLESKFHFTCKLGTNRIRIWGEMFEPREHGECGANPGGKVYMSVNKLPVLHFLNIGNACFSSVWRGTLRIHSKDSSSSAQLELCGYDRFKVFTDNEPKCVTRSVPLTQPIYKNQRPLFDQSDIEKEFGDN